MASRKNKKMIIDTSVSSVKLLHTPIGVYLKRSDPIYYARKLPYNSKIIIDKNLIIIYINKKYYYKNKFFLFDDKKTNTKNVEQL